jgi:hypothetical protein
VQSVRVAGIVPDHAGHGILDVDGPVVIGLGYLRGGDDTLVGQAMVGRTSFVGPSAPPGPTSYGFAYRTLPFTPDQLAATLFVSNPGTTSLGGRLVVYSERCEVLDLQRIAVLPGCTGQYQLPTGYFGFGRVTVLSHAVVNLLHFSANAGGLATAELLDAAVAVTEPPEQVGLLIDHTHRGTPNAADGLTRLESAVVANGIAVAHHTSGPLTAAALQPHRAVAIVLPTLAYDAAEIQAIVDFVNAGGGLLLAQDWGIDPRFGYAPWSLPARGVMSAFGLVDDSNLVLDTLHNDGIAEQLRFDVGRNFGSHPIVSGLSTLTAVWSCTLATGNGWSPVIATDADAVPPERPVVAERAVGGGRVLVLGDSNMLNDSTVPLRENLAFAVRCVEWVTFRI